ncbi:MAG: hypothetical protein QJR03_01345, partial [Sphaerobacter sp.]|nr:hypothetical protein [Sphaerobacter sp.]
PLGCAPLGRIAGAALAAELGCFLINLGGIAGHALPIPLGRTRRVGGRPSQAGARQDGVMT